MTHIMAYTQTLLPKWTVGRTLSQQFLDLKYMCHEYLSKFCTSYRLYFELHKSGNVHAHGTCCIKDNIKRYKLLWQMNQKIGNVLWKEIDDAMEWEEYCRKDSHQMEQVLAHKLPLVWCSTYTKEIWWPTATKKMQNELDPDDRSFEELDLPITEISPEHV